MELKPTQKTQLCLSIDPGNLAEYTSTAHGMVRKSHSLGCAVLWVDNAKENLCQLGEKGVDRAKPVSSVRINTFSYLSRHMHKKIPIVIMNISGSTESSHKEGGRTWRGGARKGRAGLVV